MTPAGDPPIVDFVPQVVPLPRGGRGPFDNTIHLAREDLVFLGRILMMSNPSIQWESNAMDRRHQVACIRECVDATYDDTHKPAP